LAAVAIPRPVCDLTYCGRYAALSVEAAALLSNTETNQHPPKPITIENWVVVGEESLAKAEGLDPNGFTQHYHHNSADETQKPADQRSSGG